MKSNQLILFAIISISTLLFVFNCQTARSVNALTKNAAPAGIWAGASVCASGEAACRSETLVLRVAEPDASGGISLTISSFGDDGTEATKRLDCAYELKDRALRCAEDQNKWRFELAGRQMTGALTLADGTISRRVNGARTEN